MLDQFFKSKFFAAMSVMAWPMAKDAVAGKLDFLIEEAPAAIPEET